MWTESLVLEEALAHEHQIIPYISAQRLVDSEEMICLTTCLCRSLEKNCQSPIETCLLFKEQAQVYILSGKGREISRKDALELLSTCQDSNLVHNAVVARGRIMGLCNCCGCCCAAVQGARYDFESVRDSGFQAEIDQAKCLDCGICAELCVFRAISGPRVSAQKCKGCGLCVVRCSEGAIKLRARQSGSGTEITVPSAQP